MYNYGYRLPVSKNETRDTRHATPTMALISLIRLTEMRSEQCHALPSSADASSPNTHAKHLPTRPVIAPPPTNLVTVSCSHNRHHPLRRALLPSSRHLLRPLLLRKLPTHLSTALRCFSPRLLIRLLALVLLLVRGRLGVGGAVEDFFAFARALTATAWHPLSGRSRRAGRHAGLADISHRGTRSRPR